MFLCYTEFCLLADTLKEVHELSSRDLLSIITLSLLTEEALILLNTEFLSFELNLLLIFFPPSCGPVIAATFPEI